MISSARLAKLKSITLVLACCWVCLLFVFPVAGAPVAATEALLVREVPTDSGPLPLIAVAQTNGICYAYNPNRFHFESIWKGPLGWIDDNNRFELNQTDAQGFHIREMPWRIDVGRVKFDFKWLGYDADDTGITLRYELTDKVEGRSWMIEETIDILSFLRQRIRFNITHPEASAEGLTYWLQQTNYRSVSSNGQQVQRNQLEFLKPGQSSFTLNLSRRETGQTMPLGYSVSQIAIPEIEAPYLFEPTGFSFAADGTAFVSTRTGGVWRYKDESWNQFADGLHETQGTLAAPNGREVYTMQKPELTLLRDTDSDGRADEYLSVENRFRFTGHYHEFAFGPVANTSGELFFTTGLSSSGNHEAKQSGSGQMSSALGYRGWVMKRDANGNLIPFASGLRSPAGIGMNAKDELFVTDNQGDWVASSFLGHVEAGDFLGHPASLWDRPEYGITPKQLDYRTVDARVESVPLLDEASFSKERKRPAVWLIHGDLTNSPGNASFCPPQGFGPFEGQAFIADISHRAIVRVALEKVKGVYQGAVFPFIRPLGSAAYSTRFDPQGRLWVGSVGRGWTKGDPMIEVISYDTTATPFEMHRIELTKHGFDIHFTQPIENATALAEQISVRRFHYIYWAEYGSDRQDNSTIPLKRIDLSKDGKTLSLAIPLERNKVYEIDLGPLRSAKGAVLQNNFAYYTLNELVP